MAQKETKNYFFTVEEAEADQKSRKGTPGYSEVYPQGVYEVKLRKADGEIVDGFESRFKEYYG